MHQRKYSIISLILMFILIFGLYLYKPVNLREISTADGLIQYVRSFGPVMPIVTFIILVLQAIIPVIPFIILCSANGVLFGVLNGIMITWAGTLTGASIMFFMARTFGYEWGKTQNKSNTLNRIEQMRGYRGFVIILTLRLLPYFPAPLINVSAGVSRISFFWFFLASAIGKLPFILGYTFLGYSLIYKKNYLLGVAVTVGLIIIPYVLMRLKKRWSPSVSKNPEDGR